jgi:hypothetical protein
MRNGGLTSVIEYHQNQHAKAIRDKNKAKKMTGDFRDSLRV